MTVRNLDKLFNPASLAVIGASTRAYAVGNVVMRNLLDGAFEGPIMPVNPKHRAVEGVLAYPDIDSLPMTPDLGIICTPPAVVPEVLEQLGRFGTRAAILITAGLSRVDIDGGESALEAVLRIADGYGIRLLGPNCLGLQVPALGLNASFAHCAAEPGSIAFVSQSGALCTMVLDWARPRGIGFSHFVSLGNADEVSFGDVIDYLGSHPATKAILLYIESIKDRRNFMSAARSAARNKPVIAIKAGRAGAAAAAAQSHTGALAGSDAVYDAAFRRAGMLRVATVNELFGAVETLARIPRLDGERLTIVTNGGGTGVLAMDRLLELGGMPSPLSDETVRRLNEVLPENWSRANPVDIIGDADGDRYGTALDVLMSAPDIEAILVMHAPTAVTSPTEIARAVVDRVNRPHDARTPTILTSWVGETAVQPARALFADAGLATFETPEQAVGSFMQMVEYRRNQALLMETPPSAPEEFTPATDAARLVIESALAANGDAMLSEPQAKAVLSAYGIPTVETHVVADPDLAAEVAAGMGFPVALKIVSPDISHKTDVGGVQLFLDSEDAVRQAARTMQNSLKAKAPDARLEGFSVQRMAVRPGSYETIVGIADDPVFGPVILFGHGGSAVEIIADRAVALPPLNMKLAHELITRTRIYRQLAGYRDRPPVDLDRLCLTLLQISQLVIDLPEIAELDINPLLVDEDGVLALDARIRAQHRSGASAENRLAIRPYPKTLTESFKLNSGRTVTLRPIRPEDEPEHATFIERLSPEDIRFRFFGLVRALPHTQLARFTQIDYDREMAFIATAKDDHGCPETLGVVRTVTDPDNQRSEFAIVVRSDMKGQGLGYKLMTKIIDYNRSRGTRQIVGQVLTENRGMLQMAEELGFVKRIVAEENVYEVTLDL